MQHADHIAAPQPEDPGCAVPNPKQNGVAAGGRNAWYPYYAGYSPVFVRRVLEQARLPAGALVLDPWNGAGTTTQVASDLGYGVAGFDLNPAMVLVAMGRLLDRSSLPALRLQLRDILRRASSDPTSPASTQDPLGAWLQPASVDAVRRLERAIVETTFPGGPISLSEAHAEIPAPGCFFVTAVFRSLKALLAPFRGSNPVWFKLPRDEGERISFPRDFAEHFRREASLMLDGLGGELEEEGIAGGRAAIRLETASSLEVPLRDREATIVISSPPYCTRIDYAVATRVELAVLGFDPEGEKLRRLRDRMIGTSTIRRGDPAPRPDWGATCERLLEDIARHPSRASKNYYHKSHLQYFEDLKISLIEIDRCLRPGGHCVLVLQDSYYKDIHNDLPSIVAEMAASLDWDLACRRDFGVARTMASLNGRSRRYRTGRGATESVLWFRTGA